MDYLSFRPDFESPDAVAAYDELPLWSAMFGLLLLRHVPLRRGISMLDLGCATWFPLLELAQRLGPTCRVHGLDPWEPALERARFKTRVWNLRNVEIHQGTAEAMPFADGSFDLLVSNLGVNNFDRPAAVLAECRRATTSSSSASWPAGGVWSRPPIRPRSSRPWRRTSTAGPKLTTA